jgi:hypothetical protein
LDGLDGLDFSLVRVIGGMGSRGRENWMLDRDALHEYVIIMNIELCSIDVMFLFGNLLARVCFQDFKFGA